VTDLSRQFPATAILARTAVVLFRKALFDSISRHAQNDTDSECDARTCADTRYKELLPARE